MKKILIFPIFLICLIFLTSCSNSSKIGDLEINFEKGNYVIKDTYSTRLIELTGEIDLKICNNGDKILPFLITNEIGKIDIEINSKYLEEKNQNLVSRWKTEELISNTGIIEISPSKCPIYTFYFKKQYTVTIDEKKRTDLLERIALDKSEIFFNLNNNKIKLNGISEISLTTENLEKKGLKEINLEEMDNVKIAQKNPIDEKLIESNNKLLEEYEKLVINCIYLTGEVKTCKDKIKNNLCLNNDCKYFTDTTTSIDNVVEELNNLILTLNYDLNTCGSEINEKLIQNSCEGQEYKECYNNYVVQECGESVTEKVCNMEEFSNFKEYLSCE